MLESERGRERFEDAVLLALKMVEGAMQAVFRSWKRQGNRFSSRPSRRNAALLTPRF